MRHAVALAQGILLLLISNSALGAPVIPPGQEAIVMQMCGASEKQAACAFENAQIPKDHIEAHFRCGSEATPVVAYFRHPSGDAPATFTTKKFKIELKGDAAASRLLAGELEPRVERFEGKWKWLTPKQSDRPMPNAPEAQRSGRALWLLLLIPLAIVGVRWWVYRRKQPSS